MFLLAAALCLHTQERATAVKQWREGSACFCFVLCRGVQQEDSEDVGVGLSGGGSWWDDDATTNRQTYATQSLPENLRSY